MGFVTEGFADEVAETEDGAAIDPVDGAAIDPADGTAIDPADGGAIDPADGGAIDPADGTATDPAEVAGFTEGVVAGFEVCRTGDLCSSDMWIEGCAAKSSIISETRVCRTPSIASSSSESLMPQEDRFTSLASSAT